METFSYNPDRTYSLKEFEEINDSLKVREVQINGTPVSHFERDSKGHLIPMPQTPILREMAAGEILRQLANWNIQTRQNGAPTSSQGGFNFGEGIRAPDVAFTPKEVYRALDKDQLLTFHGDPFSPTFVVEVENVSETCKLDELTDRFKTTYFPAGVELGWIPLTKTSTCLGETEIMPCDVVSTAGTMMMVIRQLWMVATFSLDSSYGCGRLMKPSRKYV
jgi:Uma2 family endonuclease